MWNGSFGQKEGRKYIQDAREGLEMTAPLQASNTHGRQMDISLVFLQL